MINALYTKKVLMLMVIVGCIVSFSAIVASSMKSEALKAFPGAEGFGSESLGGRGGQIITVENLKDTGPGTLRDAVNTKGPRTIVFEVGGVVELSSDLEIEEPYITIAGQTAPDPGITLKGAGIHIKSHDVILQHIRVRVGDKATGSNPSDADALNLWGEQAYNIIVDHCSFSWATDENVSTWNNAHDITIQWSIISEGLHNSKHKKGAHSKGMLIGSHKSKNISIHHNLFAHNYSRNPAVKVSGVVDIVNNVFYNYGSSSVGLFVNEYDEMQINFIGNFIKMGPDSKKDAYAVKMLPRSSDYIGSTYVFGNLSPHRPYAKGEEWKVVDPDSRRWLADAPFAAPIIQTNTAIDAYLDVLRHSGARPNERDAVDERIVSDVRYARGRIIDSQKEVNGWDTSKKASYRPAIALPDPLGDADDDGYLNIEEVLFYYSKQLEQ